MDTQRRYATDLTDCQWARVSGFLPEPKKLGRPIKYERRAVAIAVMYVTRGRRSWRSLPGDLPPWRIAFWYYSQWKKSGVLDRVIAEISVEQ